MSPSVRFSSSLDEVALTRYIERLLENMLPDGEPLEYSISEIVPEALERVEHCFLNIHRKYYAMGNRVEFNHLNSDHLATFLYFLSNSAWRMHGDGTVPTKIFYLNKILHGLDLYYSVQLPEIFLFSHPVGSVIGNAEYGNYLVIYQNCTIGAERGIYPRLGDGIVLYARSSVIGNCTVGSDVVFAANSFLVNTDVPDHSLVLGHYPQHRITPNTQTVRDRFFDRATV
jgi:serine O-acetyltransferase